MDNVCVFGHRPWKMPSESGKLETAVPSTPVTVCVGREQKSGEWRPFPAAGLTLKDRLMVLVAQWGCGGPV